MRQRHGHAHLHGATPTYHTWAGMLARCTNPKHSSYATYGGAGVTVCARWRTFPNFLADMGEKPEGTSLDRIDRSRGYKPSNCRWSSPKEQARNKSNNRLMTCRGETKTQAEWCELLGLTQSTVNYRLSIGWTDEQALLTPGSATNNVRSRLLTHAGKTMCVAEWARDLGVSVYVLHQRLHRGWSVERTLTEPPRQR